MAETKPIGAKDKKKEIDVNALKKVLKLYVLPLVTMTLFLIIVIVLIIPKIGEILSSLDQISQDGTTYQASQATLTDLQSVSQKSNQMLAQLNVINQTTPTSKTEVVKFRDEITSLINKNNLEILEERLSENDLLTNDPSSTDTSSTPTISNTLTLQEVPFSFQIQGQYDQLINFIKDLSVIDDFIIVREMQLNGSTSTDGSNSDIWILKLTIDKYQFSAISPDAENKLYLNIPVDSSPSQSVLDYVNSRIQ